MLTLTESVANDIRNWPTLYTCRTNVLHQYFCVIGNGMEWKNGILVDPYGNSTEFERKSMIKDEVEELADMRIRFSKHPEVLNERVIAATLLNIRRHNLEINYRINNAELLALIEWNFHPISKLNQFQASVIYPLCEYSLMNTVPDDAQPDWLAGVREMIFCVFQAPAASANHRQNDEQCIADKQRNIDFADKVLQDLHTRFGSPEGTPMSFDDWTKRSK